MASLFTNGKFQALQASGVVPGAKLYTYAAGGLTPLATYTTQAGGSSNANPVVCDANGQANVWLGTSAYRMILKDASDVTIWDVDNIATVGSSTGSSLVGFIQSGSGAVATTVQTALREHVSVKQFGATGDGVTDDTAAWLAASLVSDRVYVPDGTYLLNNLNVDYDVRFFGPGVVKTSRGTLIPVTVSEAAPDSVLRIMFLEGNLPSYEELLDIRSLGMTTVMAYPWTITDAVLVKNAEAVGLNVIIHGGFTTVPVTVTPNVALDGRASVVGYYLCDEPIINGESVVAQERAIDAYRLVTNKPLFCADNGVIYRAALLSSKWDVILSDVYYADSLASGNVAAIQAVRNYGEYGFNAPGAKILPCVGLFNDTGFAKSTTNVAKLARHLVKFSPDSSFAVFIWDAGVVAGAYAGVRNTAAYRAAVPDLVAIAKAHKPYRVEFVPVGGVNSRLHAVWKNVTDGASAGIPGAATMVPWEVTNVGGAVDIRRQTFAQDGIMVSATGGTIGFPGMPTGICASVFTYTNVSTAATATISLGYSLTGGYTYVNTTSAAAIAVSAATTVEGVLTSTTSAMPMLKVVLSLATSQPYAFLGNGYIAFSDVPSVSF